MAKIKEEKTEVHSGALAGDEAAVETEGKGKPKKGKKSKEFTDNIIRDSETAKERGRRGGEKAAETKRLQKDARESARYILSLATTGRMKDNLKEMGIEPTEMNNMNAIQAKLFVMAMGGNLDAYKEFMKIAGYDTEEIRKERESIAADRRRDMEVEAKVNAITNGGDEARFAFNMNDEDEHSDVVIYMPQMLDEKDCEFKEDGQESGKDKQD